MSTQHTEGEWRVARDGDYPNKEWREIYVSQKSVLRVDYYEYKPWIAVTTEEQP